MWKSEQHILTPKYEILCSLVTLLKYCFLTMEEDDNQFKITCQSCNGFATCLVSSGQMLYIPFICSGLSTHGIYLE